MLVKNNDIKAIKAGKKWRMNRKKLLILSGTSSGITRYEDLYDEALENYQCFLIYRNTLNPREIWDGIFDMMAKGSLTFTEVRTQYGSMVRKEALA